MVAVRVRSSSCAEDFARGVLKVGKGAGVSAAQAVKAGVAAWVTADNPWLLVSTLWFTILSTLQEWALWKQGWVQHWQGVCALEDIEARYKGMTVKLKCSDGVVREFLFDTGAAASLIPSKLFRQVCRRVGLRPSRLSLRTADGSTMVAVGTSEMHLRLPDQLMSSKPLISHRFEVLPDGMPNHLQITGVDFWDKLSPVVDFAKRLVHCTDENGDTFDLPFEIQHERGVVRTVNALLAENVLDRTHRSACTQQVLHLAPRQITKTTLLIPVNEGDAEVMPAAIRPLKVTLGNDTQRRTVTLEGIRTVKMKRLWHTP